MAENSFFLSVKNKQLNVVIFSSNRSPHGQVKDHSDGETDHRYYAPYV